MTAIMYYLLSANLHGQPWCATYGRKRVFQGIQRPSSSVIWKMMLELWAANSPLLTLPFAILGKSLLKLPFPVLRLFVVGNFFYLESTNFMVMS